MYKNQQQRDSKAAEEFGFHRLKEEIMQKEGGPWENENETSFLWEGLKRLLYVELELVYDLWSLKYCFITRFVSGM